MAPLLLILLALAACSSPDEGATQRAATQAAREGAPVGPSAEKPGPLKVDVVPGEPPAGAVADNAGG